MSVRDSRAPYAELVSVPCSTTSTSSPFVSSDSHDFASVRQWLQSLLEIQLPTTDLAISLKDGVFLCTLMNKLEPGAIQDIQYDCNTEAWARNIERFLNAAQKAGLADSQVFCVPDLLDSRDIGKVAETLSSLRDLYDAVRYRYSRIPTEQEALHKRRYAVPEHENVYNNPRGKGLEQGCEIDGARRITLYDKDAFSQPMMDSGCILHSVQPGYRSNEEDDQLAWDDMQPQFLRQKNKRNTITLASSYSSWTDSTADLSIDSIRSQRSAFVTEDQTPVSPSSRIDVISCSSNNDSETDNEVRKQERRPHNHRISSPSIFNQNSNQPDRPEKAYSSTSRLTRLSHFSFRKKTPIRQKIPFHMRYQEWTDMTTQKEISKRSAAKETPFQNDVRYQSNDDTADCFNSIGQGRKSMMLSAQSPHPSASSPVCSMAAALHELSIREPLEEDSCATQKLQSNDASMYTSTDFDDQLAMDTINRRSLDLGIPGAVPRRKSTGTFELSCKNKLSSGDNGERLELLDERGAVIARYKLGNVIGKGQFGTVYRALNLKTGQIVAIKRINLDPSISSQIDDVMQEAQLLSSLSHRNIVRYEGFIREDSCINIVLEFVENGSLLNTLKAFGSFPESLVANYSHRILQGLAYLHDKDVVHCDLKAANILTTKLGDVKLSDFGVSMNLRLTDDPSDFVAGTPNWMAPEVIELKGACTKSDIWSLGCTVIELLTGKPPYSDLIAMTTLFRIVEDDHPPIPENISTYLNDFLLQCFQKEPKDRPSAQQLLQHPWITANILDDEHDDVTKQLESSIMRRPPSSSIPRSFQYVPPSIPEHCSEDQEPCQTREAGTRPPNRRSLLFDKFTERQVKTLSRTTLRNHCFVKGSFAKAAVNCKACRLPIKRNALVCRDCGLICHDKCKTTTSCTSAQEKDTDESIKQSNETQSIQDVQDISKDPIPTFEKAPRPMSSMSTQLRERTRKLSRVFAPGNNHQNRRPHSTRSYDTLRSMSQRHCSSVAEGKDIIQVPDLDKEICNSASAGYVEASSAQRGRKKGKRPSNTSDECVIS